MAWWKDFLDDVERTYGGVPVIGKTLLGPWLHPGLRASLLHRWAHLAWGRRWTRPLAWALKRLARAATGAEIHPAARIGGGLHLPHPTGIVIGPTVQITGPATVFQQATLGARVENGDPENGPRLGPYVFVYPGARVLGRIEVGARSQIGPNCVIYRDVPEGSTVLPPEPLVLEGLSFTLRFPTPRRGDALPEAGGPEAAASPVEAVSAAAIVT